MVNVRKKKSLHAPAVILTEVALPYSAAVLSDEIEKSLLSLKTLVNILNLP